MIALLILFVLGIINMAGASLQDQLMETFSDPNWMGFEDREDEDYKWSDNIKNYQEEL